MDCFDVSTIFLLLWKKTHANVNGIGINASLCISSSSNDVSTFRQVYVGILYIRPFNCPARYFLRIRKSPFWCIPADDFENSLAPTSLIPIATSRTRNSSECKILTFRHRLQWVLFRRSDSRGDEFRSLFRTVTRDTRLCAILKYFP